MAVVWAECHAFCCVCNFAGAAYMRLTISFERDDIQSAVKWTCRNNRQHFRSNFGHIRSHRKFDFTYSATALSGWCVWHSPSRVGVWHSIIPSEAARWISLSPKRVSERIAARCSGSLDVELTLVVASTHTSRHHN